MIDHVYRIPKVIIGNPESDVLPRMNSGASSSGCAQVLALRFVDRMPSRLE
jgi:hypothetical protein